MKKYSDITKALHKDGYIFIIIFCAITFILSSISCNLGWISFFLTLFCCYFFRNPERMTPLGSDLVISPADGTIVNIEETNPPKELEIEEKMLKISIFLSVFDVHVNRVPMDGQILSLHYNPGKWLNASLDKASVHNERQSIVLQTEKNEKIVFVQIAGLIARRIVCDLEEGMNVKAGQRFGIIRFGSRVDVYLPLHAAPSVSVGQTVIGGETILANLNDQTSQKLTYAVR